MIPDPGANRSVGPRPNVVLVVMDTTRAVETVPADPDLTPTLSALAEHGTEYTRAFATAPWTLPSHASAFTGTYPSKHGATGEHTYLDDELPTVAEVFRSGGYETVGASNNVWVAEEFGFTRGFETFFENHENTRSWRDPDDLEAILTDSIPAGVPGEDALAALVRWITDRVSPPSDKGAARTVDWVRNWLEDRQREDPFFLFVNCIEPHLEYRPPRAHAEDHLPDGWTYDEAMEVRQDPREYDVELFELTDEEWSVLRGLYRAEISYLDAKLGSLLETLADAGEWEDTVVVVVGDHGENVGDHGFLGHQYCLYDTLLHVPLVAHGGPFAGGAPNSNEFVQLPDLAPTLADVADLPARDARRHYQGRSFHPRAETPPRTEVFAEYEAPRPPVEILEERFDSIPDRLYRFQRSLRCVRTERYKYVTGSDGSEWLYDLADDPEETTDVIDDHPGAAQDLRATLEGWQSSFESVATEETVSVSASTERRLSELGYL